jgi:hypothetical protein
MGETSNLIAPLPWFKSRGVYVQGAKADKTRDDLSCNVLSVCEGHGKETAFKPVPIIEPVRGEK